MKEHSLTRERETDAKVDLEGALRLNGDEAVRCLFLMTIASTPLTGGPADLAAQDFRIADWSKKVTQMRRKSERFSPIRTAATCWKAFVLPLARTAWGSKAAGAGESE